MSRYSAQQSSISENNRSRILQYLYHNGICSRAQIAKAIKLTPAAITKITATPARAPGIIEETGDMEGAKNRRSIGLKLNTARKYHVIGVKFARSSGADRASSASSGNRTCAVANLPTV